jgi:hypothetical protein
MERSHRDTKKLKKRAGFSLIVVMIISFIGFAVVGATLQFMVNAGGSGRVTNASGARYNLLQEAAEVGKAWLKEKMDNTDPIPRHANADDEDEPPIDELSDLLINADMGGPASGVVKNDTISPSALGRLGIMDNTGGGGVLNVSIYDMQYAPELVDSGSMSASELRMLPPSIIFNREIWATPPKLDAVDEKSKGAKGDLNKGMYLIRATLSVGGRDTTLDTAVIQRNSN